MYLADAAVCRYDEKRMQHLGPRYGPKCCITFITTTNNFTITITSTITINSTMTIIITMTSQANHNNIIINTYTITMTTAMASS